MEPNSRKVTISASSVQVADNPVFGEVRQQGMRYWAKDYFRIADNTETQPTDDAINNFAFPVSLPAGLGNEWFIDLEIETLLNST